MNKLSLSNGAIYILGIKFEKCSKKLQIYRQNPIKFSLIKLFRCIGAYLLIQLYNNYELNKTYNKYVTSNNGLHRSPINFPYFSNI